MSTPASTATTGGGAWEAILDKASTAVTEYLAATKRDFDPAAPLSQHMLHLIDRGTLRDIVVERNYNQLCARLGCGSKPRGLVQAGDGTGGTLSFDWESSDSASSSGTDEDEAAGDMDDTSHEKRKGGGAKAVTSQTSSGDKGTGTAEDAEEIVYEDDLYTAESFRLAERQRALLNRMQRKKLRREQHALRAAAAAATTASAAVAVTAAGAPVVPRVLRSGMPGASFPQRFCCAECEEMHESAILPRVSTFVTHDYPTVLGAVTNLFPNLQVAALQQLAGAETSAAGLVRSVVETQGGTVTGTTTATHVEAGAEAALKPVQVGVSYESCAHLPRSRADTVKSMAAVRSGSGGGGVANASTASASSPVLLREVLEQMAVLQHVWNHEVVPRFSESHLPRVAAAQKEEEGVVTAGLPASAQALASAPQQQQQWQQQPPQPRPALRGSLLLFDFLMNASSETTRRVFLAHFTQHRAALLTRCGPSATASIGGGGEAMGGSQSLANASLFRRVSSSIITALEARRAASAGRDGYDGCDDDGDELRIDPVLQQQRRELLVSHLFSDEVTATLSRLLLVDYSVLSNGAWSGVWFKDVPLPARAASSCSASGPPTTSVSLLRSLRFPFAVPAVLLQAPGATPEVLGLAMVLLIAAGCCSDVVWRGCVQAEVAFEEVAEAVGLPEDDIAAAVRSVMLGEED